MGKRGPKPGFRREQPTEPVAHEPCEPAEPVSSDAFQRGRRLDDMEEPELRAYGTQIGLSRRDATSLAVPRLRAACVLMLQQRIDDI